MEKEIIIGNLYRLPWTYEDNPFTLLNVTYKCNLGCKGCELTEFQNSHKCLTQIMEELDYIKSNRETGAIIISGGNPLLHPNLIEIVRMIKKRDWDAIINTNGNGLEESFLRDLKRAGADGFAFHIDSRQARQGFEGRNEEELNGLRQKYADMTWKAGGLSCSFCVKIYPETIQYAPDILKWAGKNIEKVQSISFNLNSMSPLRHKSSSVLMMDAENESIKAEEFIDFLRDEESGLAPNSYLNGMPGPLSVKALSSDRIGNESGILGYTGPKFMELSQMAGHFFSAKYSYFDNSRWLKYRFFFSFLDDSLRKTFKNYIKSIALSPRRLFSKLYRQSVIIIQEAESPPGSGLSFNSDYCGALMSDHKFICSCGFYEQYRKPENVKHVPKDKGYKELMGGDN